MSNRIAIARWVILAALVAASLACSWIPFVGGGEDDPASVSDAEYFKSVAYTPQPAPSGPTPRPQEVIYDRDSNQLIDIQNLDQLNAVRYDLNGDGIPSDELAYWQSFPGGRPGMGCPDGCIGYELAGPLDFGDPDSYLVGVVSIEWIEASGGGWKPLGTDAEPFTAIFEGNGHSIRGLRLEHAGALPSGLIGTTNHDSELRNLELTSVRVQGGSRTGGLVGDNKGLILNCSVFGLVTGEIGVGGLAGINRFTGVIRKSYYRGAVHGFDTVGGAVGLNENGWIDSTFAEANLTGRQDVGGLIGRNTEHGSAQLVYAYGRVLAAKNAGGLVGSNAGEIRLAHTAGYIEALETFGGLIGSNELTGTLAFSYSTVLVGADPNVALGGGVIGAQRGAAEGVVWDTTTSRASTGVYEGSDVGLRGELAHVIAGQIQYDGPLADWNVDIDGDGYADDPWEFGEATDYPNLRADIDGDGDATADEFGRQRQR